MNTSEIHPEQNLTTKTFKLLPFFTSAQAKFVIFLLAIVFYTPSVQNEYALDDAILIHQNNFVLKGVKGLADIFSNDTYSAFYTRMNADDQLIGGRYSPLPQLSYALEQEIIGTYRSGYYLQTEDINKNGKLDDYPVVQKKEHSNFITYEYNSYKDLDGDGKADYNECYYCWDKNQNFENDQSEDVNFDGVFNEIDCQVKDAYIRHLTNIILYAVCCLLLFQLLERYVFANKDLAFLTALLFCIQPVHSEVVANIRGRDDLLMMLFMMTTLLASFKYLETKKPHLLILLVFSALLAFLSKIYGFVLPVIIPLIGYFSGKTQVRLKSIVPVLLSGLVLIFLMIASDHFAVYLSDNQWLHFAIMALVAGFIQIVVTRLFAKNDPVSLLITAIFWAAFISLFLRLSSVNTAFNYVSNELLNNPFLYANGEESFATKLYVQLLNLKLSIWPGTLVSDYSYNSIDLVDFSSVLVWLSLIIHIVLVVLAAVLTRQRHPSALGIWLYIPFILINGNFFIHTGLIYSERFLFQASIGSSIVLASLAFAFFSYVTTVSNRFAKSIIVLLLLFVIVPAGIKSWERCKDWKNDITLFLKDVRNAPNSVLVLGNAGARWIDLADTKEITGINLTALDSARYNDYNGTLVITNEEMRAGNFPDKRTAAINKGINYLLKAVQLHPKYVNGYLNLGLAYFKLGQDDKAVFYWKVAEYYYPNNPYLNNYYTVYQNILQGRADEAFEAKHYEEALLNYKLKQIIVGKTPENSEKMAECYQALSVFDNSPQQHKGIAAPADKEIQRPAKSN